MKRMRILKSKRGIALENAVLFMVLIFSLCILLTSLTLIGHHQVKLENKMLLLDVEIEQIGEDYLVCLEEQTDFTNVYEHYDYAISENVLTVWRKSDENKRVALYVEAEFIDGRISLKQWRYSPPPQTE